MTRAGLALLLPLLAFVLPALADPGVPRGWLISSSVPAKDFEIGTAPVAGAGKQAAYIKARAGAPAGGFVGLAQCISPANYLDKRLRFSANLRPVNASAEQLWMRVDGASPGGGKPPRILGFYNNGELGIGGTADWKRYDVVLDVPKESENICYGFLLAGGKGEAWADDLKVEAVPRTVPVSQFTPPKAPVNLGFDK